MEYLVIEPKGDMYFSSERPRSCSVVISGCGIEGAQNITIFGGTNEIRIESPDCPALVFPGSLPLRRTLKSLNSMLQVKHSL